MASEVRAEGWVRPCWRASITLTSSSRRRPEGTTPLLAQQISSHSRERVGNIPTNASNLGSCSNTTRRHSRSQLYSRRGADLKTNTNPANTLCRAQPKIFWTLLPGKFLHGHRMSMGLMTLCCAILMYIALSCVDPVSGCGGIWGAARVRFACGSTVGLRLRFRRLASPWQKTIILNPRQTTVKQ